LHYLDSAQRAIQWRRDSRKPTGTQRACALHWDWESDVPRHPLSGDMGGGVESPPARPMSSGFAAKHRRLFRSEKHEVVGWPGGWLRSQRPTDAGREYQVETGGQVFGSDVTARDVQAVTSPANRIATAKQSLGALRAAALGAGDKPQRQSPSLHWLSRWEPIRH
jgi:hypothetical protein